MNNIIKIELPEGTEDEWKEIGGKIVLVEEKKADNPPVTERIKTFDDACNELGEENVLVQAYRTAEFNTSGNQSDVSDVVAYLKLRVIAEALNEGWKPQFTKDECRWYPWFTFLTEKELNEMSDEFKSKHNICLFGGLSNDGASCGLAFVRSLISWSTSLAAFSARLAVKSEELAVYFGNQFIDIWADYLICKS